MPLVLEPNLVANLMRSEAERFEPRRAENSDHIVQLMNAAFGAYPMHDVAHLEIDHHQPTAGRRSSRSQMITQSQALKFAARGRDRPMTGYSSPSDTSRA